MLLSPFPPGEKEPELSRVTFRGPKTPLASIIDGGLGLSALVLAAMMQWGVAPLFATAGTTSPFIVSILASTVFSVTIFSNHFIGLHRNRWRQITIHEILLIARVSVLPAFALILLSVTRITPWAGASFYLLFTGWLSLLLLFRYFVLGEIRLTRSRPEHARIRRVLIAGSEKGEWLALEIRSGVVPFMEVVGFVDDDPTYIGGRVKGWNVYGPLSNLETIVKECGANEVLIAERYRARRASEIKRTCQKLGLPCRTVPSLAELLDHRSRIAVKEPISTEELLGRDVVHLKSEEIFDALQDRTILITGAGGSIGSEVCRQLLQCNPAAIILLDNAETPLYEIDYELRNSRLKGDAQLPRIVSVIGDIRDTKALIHIFQSHDIQTVFHCAAYKHVPMMELNSPEAVMNNIVGSKNIADVARDFGVDRFVMISTDKAVNPVNIMGATKRIAELYIQNLARATDTRYITVRFGNVLGSSGSVIPLFQKQIAQGGPVTVTHPDIIRYFMTMEEAAGLVIQAGSMGQGGEIYLLDMGEPVKIRDLAEDMIRLAGSEPHRDIEIRYIGLRPGEKLFEELLLAEEGVEKTHHPKIHIASSSVQMSLAMLNDRIAMLEEAATLRSRQAVDSVIASILPEYRPVYIMGYPEMALPLQSEERAPLERSATLQQKKQSE